MAWEVTDGKGDGEDRDSELRGGGNGISGGDDGHAGGDGEGRQQRRARQGHRAMVGWHLGRMKL